MASESRWHHSSCKRPSIVLVDGIPYCSSCSMVPLSRASGDPDSAIATIHDFDDLAPPDEIRILRLSSGQPQDPLHGVLEKYRLREFSGYETLSYTWACYDDGNNQRLTDHSKSRVIYLGDYWTLFRSPRTAITHCAAYGIQTGPV